MDQMDILYNTGDMANIFVTTINGNVTFQNCMKFKKNKTKNG